MSKAICIMGESGAGKTTSMRNLDPTTTCYIDCDMKGLAWKGWKNQYSTENKNFIATRDIPKISACLDKISTAVPQIKQIVIDTLNTCMLEHEIEQMQTLGFGKWIDLTQYVWEICSKASCLRDDLTVIIVMHSETITDDFGYKFTRIKTNGRKLEKVILESLFGTVLLAKKTDDGRYIFETQAKNSTAKSPMGAFDNFEIDNDIVSVLEALKDF